MKVALVHDWLVGMRGGEKCLEVACEVFPEADIFTLVHKPGAVSATIERHRIHTSFLQGIPGITRNYRWFLPFFPMAIERFDLSGYDLVLSMSHAVAKGAIPGPQGRHACYCFSPMRYVWDQYDEYFGPRGTAKEFAISRVATRLRTWDVAATARVDEVAAISEHVRSRIERYWRRESTILYPPVGDEYFVDDLPSDAGAYFLVVSALVPYKRIDRAIEASRLTGAPLKVVGEGPELAALQRDAPASVEWLGWQPAEKLPSLYRGAKALLFPGVEDFGITPLEAQACGRPVIALRAGGVLETVREGENPTGLFFDEPTGESLAGAIERFSALEADFSPATARDQARRFGRARFAREIEAFARGPQPC